jgi:trigger factor
VTQKFKDKDEWLEKEVKPTAVKRVQAGLALAELSKVEKIDATNEELEAHIDLYRAQYAKNAEVLKQFDDPEVRRDIANRLLTEKTVDRLVELNK